LLIRDADGTDIVQLTDNELHDEGPAWSPDGRLITFTRSDTEDAPGDVWVMNADGSDAGPLTSTPVIEESPDWQPLKITVGAADEPRTACGDLSLVPGGVASIVAVKSTCVIALARPVRSPRRQEGDRIRLSRAAGGADSRRRLPLAPSPSGPPARTPAVDEPARLPSGPNTGPPAPGCLFGA
jgi:hypothetical protein